MCPPMGTIAANWKKRRLRYVAVFWAAFRQVSACLPVYVKMGVPAEEFFASNGARTGPDDEARVTSAFPPIATKQRTFQIGRFERTHASQHKRQHAYLFAPRFSQCQSAKR